MNAVTKTVFITIYDGLISKNILGSDAFRLLKERPDVRIVLFVQPNKVEYFEAKYRCKSVSVEASPGPTYPRLESFLFWITTFSSRTPGSLHRMSSYSWHTPIKYVSARTLRFLGKFRRWRSVLRKIYELVPDSSYDAYLHTYKPDLIFVANLLSSQDTRLMKVAKKKGIRTVGMVKSWDNIGNKAFIYLACDTLIVPNVIAQEEAEEVLAVPRESIRVVGLPQFDMYVDKSLITSREMFFNKIGADPTKKLILFAATGREWTPHEPEIIEELSKAIEDGRVKIPMQVLVRFHPKYENPEERLATLPHLICERPGTFSTGKLGEWEFERDDIVHLLNSLYHADVCINTASTMALESMVFDKPTIGIAFDGSAQLPIFRSVRRFYDLPHNKILVSFGGEDVVYSFSELVESIHRACTDPGHRALGRALTREKECYQLDGRAGERIANVILSALHLS